MDPSRRLDEDNSEYVRKINECLQFIEELQAERAGSSTDKPLSTS
jgi:hypothetical protein